MFNASFYVKHIGPLGERLYILDVRINRPPIVGQQINVLGGVECKVIEVDTIDNAVSVTLSTIDHSNQEPNVVERYYEEFAHKKWRYTHS